MLDSEKLIYRTKRSKRWQFKPPIRYKPADIPGLEALQGWLQRLQFKTMYLKCEQSPL